MTNDILRVGVLGPGRIVRRVMKDFHAGQGYELTAVASRSPERAREAAREYGAKYAFGSYDELAACQEVDLVYIAVPHPFHCPLALRMMEHGKHVLCEKPMALNEDETRRMTECARAHGVFLMEAMWTRFFPAMRKMVSLVRAGAVGQVNHIYSVFSGASVYDPASRAFDPALGGRRAAGHRRVSPHGLHAAAGLEAQVGSGRLAPGSQRRGHAHGRAAGL